MKYILSFLFLFGLTLLFACNNKECIQDNACSEKPPTDELCQMAVQAWFYNSETKECEQIGYSGCEIYGFPSKEECEKCDCTDDKITTH